MGETFPELCSSHAQGEMNEWLIQLLLMSLSLQALAFHLFELLESIRVRYMSLPVPFSILVHSAGSSRI